MFVIFTIGDIDLLVAVLNGVAMLTAAGADFDGMVRLGLIIGLLMVAARGLVTQRLELQWVLVGWLLYATMFVPKVQVTLEDIETGRLEAVANVPIGVAGLGMVTSQLGLGMAEAFQTVFNPPGSPGAGPASGYADALNILAAMRDTGYGSANDAAAGVQPNVDVQRSLSRYLRDCVMRAIATEGSPLNMTWEQLRTSPDLLNEINVPAVAWHTVTYLAPAQPDGTTQTCQAAHADIAGALNGGFSAEWFDYLGAKLGLTNPQAEVQNAIDYVLGTGDTAQAFMLNAVLAKEIELADLNYQAAAGNSAGVIMRTQAIEQRRVQWATEQSLFEEVARPLMGYVEAFFYAVSPIMGFIFVLGQFGVSLFARYLLLAAWIQLWMPIMAVNNLYIHQAASRELENLATSGVSLISMVGLDSVWTETASWIAVGGMMAAATPLLALMLLSGSYFAMTRLTDRMSGRDYTNEKIMAPDVLQPAAVAASGVQFQQETGWLSGEMYGVRQMHAESLAPKLEWDVERRTGASETWQEMASHTEQWQRMASQTARATLSSREGASQALETVTSGQASFTSMDTATWNQADEIMNQHMDVNRLSEQEREFMKGTLGLSIAAGGMQYLPAGIRAAFESGLEHSMTAEFSDVDQAMESMKTAVGNSQSSAASMRETISTSERAAQDSVFAKALGMDEAEGFSRTAAGLESTSQTLSAMQTDLAEIGVEQDMSSIAFGRMFEEHREALWTTAIAAGISEGAIGYQTGVMKNIYGMGDAREAETAALGILLTQNDPGAAFATIAVSQGAREGAVPMGDIAASVTPAGQPQDAPDLGVGRSAEEIEQSVELGIGAVAGSMGGARMPAEAFQAWRGEEVQTEGLPGSVADAAELYSEQHGAEALQDQTRTYLDQYEERDPPGTHPFLKSQIRTWEAAHPGGEPYIPPMPDSREGQMILRSFRNDAAEAGIHDEPLQGHYARMAAHETMGMPYDAEDYPSREDLAEGYAHGEEVVGYIENAARAHSARTTENDLAAAAHIIEHPLSQDGGAGTGGDPRYMTNTAGVAALSVGTDGAQPEPVHLVSATPDAGGQPLAPEQTDAGQ